MSACMHACQHAHCKSLAVSAWRCQPGLHAVHGAGYVLHHEFLQLLRPGEQHNMCGMPPSRVTAAW
jgi:hypothetical protein